MCGSGSADDRPLSRRGVAPAGARPRLLADRRLRLVLAGLVGSSAANGLLPVTESFAVLQVTGSAGKLGLVLSGQAAVTLVVSLIGGVAGDKRPRGQLLAISTLVRMAAAAVLAFLLFMGAASFGWLLAISVVYGCANGFFGPASGAIVPDIVALDRLGEANALIGGLSSAASVVAPSIAGIVVALLGPGAGFAAEAALLAITAGCITAARIPAARETGLAPAEGVVRQLRTGWRVYLRLRWLWLLTLQWTAFSLLVLAPLTVLGPDIALRFLGGAAAWGVISSCLAVGVVGGQFAAGRLRLSRPLQAAACLCPAGIAEAFALGLGAPALAVAFAAVISGLAMGVQFVVFQATLQRTVPAVVLARVTAFDLVGSEIGQPLGYALAGPGAEAFGLRAFMTACAAVALVLVVPFAAAPSLREPDEALVRLGVESLERP
jgi:MFS family permease